MAILRTAIIQMRSGTCPAENFEQARSLIKQAVTDGASFVTTPENTGLMQMDHRKMLAQIQPEENDPSLALFRQLARQLEIHILIGSLAIKVSPKQAANRSYMLAPNGQITARYDKIHLFDVQVSNQETWAESDHIRAGSKAVLAQLDEAVVGLSICYDVRFANLYQRLAKAGAQILIVPAAFTRVTGKAHWQELLVARAIETASYVVAPAQGGAHEDGRRTWGRSMIIDPWGKIIAKLDHDQPGTLVADLDTSLVERTRQRIPVLQQSSKFTGP